MAEGTSDTTKEPHYMGCVAARAGLTSGKGLDEVTP